MSYNDNDGGIGIEENESPNMKKASTTTIPRMKTITLDDGAKTEVSESPSKKPKNKFLAILDQVKKKAEEQKQEEESPQYREPSPRNDPEYKVPYVQGEVGI
jgi:hypothetical protein